MILPWQYCISQNVHYSQDWSFPHWSKLSPAYSACCTFQDRPCLGERSIYFWKVNFSEKILFPKADLCWKTTKKSALTLTLLWHNRVAVSRQLWGHQWNCSFFVNSTNNFWIHFFIGELKTKLIQINIFEIPFLKLSSAFSRFSTSFGALIPEKPVPEPLQARSGWNRRISPISTRTVYFLFDPK